jgi:uncharacterized ParB-like nuclease family protein
MQGHVSPTDPLLTNRYGFIEAIIEKWKIDGQNLFWSFQGCHIHNGVFEVLIEVKTMFSINTSNAPL